MKRCYKCNTEKPMDDFAKRTMSPDGKQLWCRLCMNTRNTANAKQRTENGPTIIRNSKTCRQCLSEKPIGQFYVKRNSADGYGSYCKPCWARRVQSQPSYRGNKQKMDGINNG